MKCDSCGKEKENLPNRWINYALSEEYKICDDCAKKMTCKSFID